MFLISINFNPIKFFNSTLKIYNFFFERNKKNYVDKNEIINEYIPQEEIKNLIQEDLPFIKAESKESEKIRFQLPTFDLLKTPTKEEREKSNYRSRSVAKEFKIIEEQNYAQSRHRCSQ